jgi:hypothetical protein
MDLDLSLLGWAHTVRGNRGLRVLLRSFVLIAAIAFGTRIGNCEAPQARPNQVAFQSTSYADFRQLLTREPVTATVTVPPP